MKRFVLPLLLLLFIMVNGYAQDSIPALDKSSMDVSYCPDNYPLLKIQDKLSDPLIARIIYSRPQKNGRKIFGELIEYGKVWRLGANEATEIEFYKNVAFGNTRIKKGRYTLYAIPNEKEWTIILNKETDIWGSFRYDNKKDVARITVPVEKLTNINEVFTIVFKKIENTYQLRFYWDDVKITVPVTL